MSSKMQSIVNSFVDAVKKTGGSEGSYDTAATVKRVENGIAYVSIPGGAKETPVKLTMDAKPGDEVQVRISGHRAWLQGNATAPPTDDTTANYATNTARAAQKTADAAVEDAYKAYYLAGSAKQIADDTEQHFWFTETGTDTGAHIGEVTKDEWEDSTSTNYHSGGNLLARSNGIAVRQGMTELASFGVDGVQIGQTGTALVRTTRTGIEMTDVLGNPVSTITSSGATSTEQTTVTFVNYEDDEYYYISPGNSISFTFAENNFSQGNIGLVMQLEYYRASPWALWVAIRITRTISSLPDTFTISSNDIDYAEVSTLDTGLGTTNFTITAIKYIRISKLLMNYWSTIYAPVFSFGNRIGNYGRYSTIEGYNLSASGDYSHAQNLGTIASSESQTSIGKYNIEDTEDKYPLIVGNGTGDNSRSNAFTIDWSGNVDIPTGSAYKVNGTSLIDLIYPVGSIYMSVNNTDPGLLFGGTWQQIQDSFLLAAGTTYSAGATGGTASHTLSESNLPKITGTVKLASNIARNTDTANTLLESASGKFTRVESTNQNVVKLNSSTSTVSTGKTLYTSAKYEFGQTTPTSLDNLPPYLAVYVWKRTA